MTADREREGVADIYRRATQGGYDSRSAMVFRRWRGEPVHMIDPSWSAPASEMGGPLRGVPTLTVWCGPSAPDPQPPTSRDLLDAAGITWAVTV